MTATRSSCLDHLLIFGRRHLERVLRVYVRHYNGLRAERLPADTFAQLGPDHVRIAKTASRSTLGYMKEMAFELEWNIANDGGLDRIDIDELNHALRRQLRSHGRDYAGPIELSTSTSPTSTGPRTPDTFTSAPPASPAADFLNPTGRVKRRRTRLRAQMRRHARER